MGQGNRHPIHHQLLGGITHPGHGQLDLREFLAIFDRARRRTAEQRRGAAAFREARVGRSGQGQRGRIVGLVDRNGHAGRCRRGLAVADAEREALGSRFVDTMAVLDRPGAELGLGEGAVQRQCLTAIDQAIVVAVAEQLTLARCARQLVHQASGSQLAVGGVDIGGRQRVGGTLINVKGGIAADRRHGTALRADQHLGADVGRTDRARPAPCGLDLHAGERHLARTAGGRGLGVGVLGAVGQRRRFGFGQVGGRREYYGGGAVDYLNRIRSSRRDVSSSSHGPRHQRHHRGVRRGAEGQHFVAAVLHPGHLEGQAVHRAAIGDVRQRIPRHRGRRRAVGGRDGGALAAHRLRRAGRTCAIDRRHAGQADAALAAGGRGGVVDVGGVAQQGFGVGFAPARRRRVGDADRRIAAAIDRHRIKDAVNRRRALHQRNVLAIDLEHFACAVLDAGHAEAERLDRAASGRRRNVRRRHGKGLDGRIDVHHGGDVWCVGGRGSAIRILIHHAVQRHLARARRRRHRSVAEGDALDQRLGLRAGEAGGRVVLHGDSQHAAAVIGHGVGDGIRCRSGRHRRAGHQRKLLAMDIQRFLGAILDPGHHERERLHRLAFWRRHRDVRKQACAAAGAGGGGAPAADARSRPRRAHRDREGGFGERGRRISNGELEAVRAQAAGVQVLDLVVGQILLREGAVHAQLFACIRMAVAVDIPEQGALAGRLRDAVGQRRGCAVAVGGVQRSGVNRHRCAIAERDPRIGGQHWRGIHRGEGHRARDLQAGAIDAAIRCATAVLNPGQGDDPMRGGRRVAAVAVGQRVDQCLSLRGAEAGMGERDGGGAACDADRIAQARHGGRDVAHRGGVGGHQGDLDVVDFELFIQTIGNPGDSQHQLLDALRVPGGVARPDRRTAEQVHRRSIRLTEGDRGVGARRRQRWCIVGRRDGEAEGGLRRGDAVFQPVLKLEAERIRSVVVPAVLVLDQATYHIRLREGRAEADLFTRIDLVVAVRVAEQGAVGRCPLRVDRADAVDQRGRIVVHIGRIQIRRREEIAATFGDGRGAVAADHGRIVHRHHGKDGLGADPGVLHVRNGHRHCAVAHRGVLRAVDVLHRTQAQLHVLGGYAGSCIVRAEGQGLAVVAGDGDATAGQQGHQSVADKQLFCRGVRRGTQLQRHRLDIDRLVVQAGGGRRHGHAGAVFGVGGAVVAPGGGAVQVHHRGPGGLHRGSGRRGRNAVAHCLAHRQGAVGHRDGDGALAGGSVGVAVDVIDGLQGGLVVGPGALAGQAQRRAAIARNGDGALATGVGDRIGARCAAGLERQGLEGGAKQVVHRARAQRHRGAGEVVHVTAGQLVHVGNRDIAVHHRHRRAPGAEGGGEAGAASRGIQVQRRRVVHMRDGDGGHVTRRGEGRVAAACGHVGRAAACGAGRPVPEVIAEAGGGAVLLIGHKADAVGAGQQQCPCIGHRAHIFPAAVADLVLPLAAIGGVVVGRGVNGHAHAPRGVHIGDHAHGVVGGVGAIDGAYQRADQVARVVGIAGGIFSDGGEHRRAGATVLQHWRVVGAVERDGQHADIGLRGAVGDGVVEGVDDLLARLERLHIGRRLVDGVGVGAVSGGDGQRAIDARDGVGAVGFQHASFAQALLITGAQPGDGLGVAGVGVGVVGQYVAAGVAAAGAGIATGFGGCAGVVECHRRHGAQLDLGAVASDGLCGAFVVGVGHLDGHKLAAVFGG